VLATTAVAFATGALAAWLHNGLAAEYAARARHTPRLFDQTVSWMGAQGATLHRATLAAAFGATALVQIVHFDRAYAPREVALIEALYAGFFAAWLIAGRSRRAMAPHFFLQACALGAFLVVRQQILLTRGLWVPHYDVWASLVAFFGLVGARQLLDRQPREVLVPLNAAFLALPAFSVSWVALHHLGTETGLLVVGLHSAAFTYLGRHDRESQYHLVGVGGFVAFVILLFYSELHLRAVYAYVVPVGVGVLVLLQLFRERIPAELRTGIRTVTLLAMLASAGAAVLLDSRTLTYHDLALVVLCLGAMGIGGLVKVKLYVVLGFTALMTDLGSVFVKTAAQMERSVRMTVVGSLVLLIGAALVFGAIYYKAHQQELAAFLERWRLRLAGWE
jgi:hypothetical protein